MAELTATEGAMRKGWALSTYAAAVNWTGGRNTRDWLHGLRFLIEAVQEACVDAGYAGPGMTTAGPLALDTGPDAPTSAPTCTREAPCDEREQLAAELSILHNGESWWACDGDGIHLAVIHRCPWCGGHLGGPPARKGPEVLTLNTIPTRRPS